MAIAVQETLSTATSSGTTLAINTGDFTPNPSVGDLLIAQFSFLAEGATITLPSGWTQIVKTENVGAGLTSQISYKIADASDATGQSLTFSKGAGDQSLKLVMLRITGHRAVSTITASSGQENDATATVTAPTVTPAEPNSAILFCMASTSADGTVSGYATATSSPSFTELYDSNANNGQAAIAFAVRPEVTATGNGTATLSGSADNIGQMVVICAPQVTTISDTVTTSDSILVNLSILVSDIISATDTITSTISRLWTKLTRNVKSWTNQNKD